MPRSWRRPIVLVALPLATVLLGGCGLLTAPGAGAPPDPAVAPVPVDPASVQANELGLVPVLMYHRLVEDPESVYDRTPTDFRAELERLAQENYTPVTTTEYVNGRMDVPAGRHPVVLTFDDGDPSTLSVDENGHAEPGTALAILDEVAAAHPDFRPVASLYVNADPFGGGASGERALRWAVARGHEIGNHTAGHTNLRTAQASRARRDVERGAALITEAVPGHPPTTLSLPFGARPRDAAVLPTGEYAGVLLVGANPAPSPFSADFEAAAVPRIRSQGGTGEGAEYGSTSWLDQLAAAPATRYTSDGDPTRVAFPRTTTDEQPAVTAAVTAHGLTTLAY